MFVLVRIIDNITKSHLIMLRDLADLELHNQRYWRTNNGLVRPISTEVGNMNNVRMGL
jgi:hypothetical protein